MILSKTVALVISESFSTRFNCFFANSQTRKQISLFQRHYSFKTKQSVPPPKLVSKRKLKVVKTKKNLLPDSNGYPNDNRKEKLLDEDAVSSEGLYKFYLRLKKQFPEQYILALQNGDFYEFFDEDAVTASELTGIILTRRRGSIRGALNFSGFPSRSLDTFLPKFLKNGKYVILAEQIPEGERTPDEDDSTVNGQLMKLRRVTRVITPGTITEDFVLEKGSNNYLLSLYLGSANGACEIANIVDKQECFTSVQLQQMLSQYRIGLAWIDISTGSYQFIQSNLRELEGYLHRLTPKEILVDNSNPLVAKYLIPLIGRLRIALTPRLSMEFQLESGVKILEEIFGTNSNNSKQLASLIDSISPFEIQASSALLRYIKHTQLGKFPFIEFPCKKRYISDHRYNSMQIDPESFKSLEILKHFSGENKGSLLATIDYTKTPYGSRLLVQRLQSPLIDLHEINNRLDFVDLFANNSHFLAEIQVALSKFSADVERSLQRLVLNRSSSGPKDLVNVKKNLFSLADLKSSLVEYTSSMYKNKELSENQFQFLTDLVLNLGDFNTFANELDDIFVESPPYKADEGGLIKKDYNGPQLPSDYSILNQLIESTAGKTDNLLAKYKRKTGIDSFKIQDGPYVGMLLTISPNDDDRIKKYPEFEYNSKTSSVIRYQTAELNHLRVQHAEAIAKLQLAECNLYESFRLRVVSMAESLKKIVNIVAEIDVAAAIAELSGKSHYTRPILTDSSSLTFEVTGGRHPVIEGLRAQENKNFVYNDTNLHADDCRFLLITGPNMGGKSTYLRQNALIAIMAQCGFYVPASYVKISIVDAIFTRIGAADDLSRDRSTFMMEMIQTSNILSQATSRSLVIMDEIGRGTSSDEGLAIAWSVCYHLYEVIQCRTFFATHYKELAGLLSKCPLMKDFMTSAKIDESNGGKIYFHHRMERGVAKLSFGIHIAKLAGLPDQAISDAKEKFAEICKRSPSIIRKSASKKLHLDPIFPSALSISSISSLDNTRLEKLSKSLSSVNLEDMAPRQALNMLYDLKNYLH